MIRSPKVAYGEIGEKTNRMCKLFRDRSLLRIFIAYPQQGVAILSLRLGLIEILI